MHLQSPEAEFDSMETFFDVLITLTANFHYCMFLFFRGLEFEPPGLKPLRGMWRKIMNKSNSFLDDKNLLIWRANHPLMHVSISFQPFSIWM